jgi:hypothetical protein
MCSSTGIPARFKAMYMKRAVFRLRAAHFFTVAVGMGAQNRGCIGWNSKTRSDIILVLGLQEARGCRPGCRSPGVFSKSVVFEGMSHTDIGAAAALSSQRSQQAMAVAPGPKLPRRGVKQIRMRRTVAQQVRPGRTGRTFRTRNQRRLSF